MPQIDIAPHGMSSNTSPPPYVASASSEYYLACHAFDGSISYAGGDWLGSGGGTDWLLLDTGGSYTLISYAIQVNNLPEPSRAPKNWTFEGSNNATTWTTLDTQTNQTSWGSSETRTFTITGASAYRYFRVNISANNGDATYTQIAELYLYQSATAYGWGAPAHTNCYGARSELGMPSGGSGGGGGGGGGGAWIFIG